MEYKYPYIPNKRMYAAVMGACSYIRDKGYFNKAVRYYADKYNVDEDELAQHIRARQSAGQRGKSPKSKAKKYKWFIVCETTDLDIGGETRLYNPTIVKGLSRETVQRRYSDADWNRTCRAYTGSSFDTIYGHTVVSEHETEEEAKTALNQYRGKP